MTAEGGALTLLSKMIIGKRPESYYMTKLVFFVLFFEGDMMW